MRKNERIKVEYPMWRKKVDYSLFEHKGTTIPLWVCEMWELGQHFVNAKKKKDSPNTIIMFGGKQYDGYITTTKPKNRKNTVYRLYYNEDLQDVIKNHYTASYMRSLENRLSNEGVEAEKDNPFWEFLDIEYDVANNVFYFTDYYIQKPSHPELFKRLLHSPALKKIDNELSGKDVFRIYKQDWKPRSDFEYEIGAQNVIYTLLDTKHKKIYVGEAADLIKRFKQGHSVISSWDYYRYDVLPKGLEPYRKALERMKIRDYASILNNRKDIPTIGISLYELVNEKIDK